MGGGNKKMVCNHRVSPWYSVFFVLLLSGGFTRAKQQRDSRDGRAGDVSILEDGRISLSRVAAMLTSSVFTELAGSEDAFRRLLDFEWEQFAARPAGTRGSFLVCSAPGRANARRLRELAGADSLVETLHQRRGEILCSFASLDAATAALVAAEGRGGGGGGDDGGQRGTFSLEPLPHLAKLAPAVAADPSPAALLLSSEAASWEGRVRVEGSKNGGVSNQEGGGAGGGGRRLGAGTQGKEHSEMAAEQRARVLAEAAAGTGPTGADRPATRRLIQDGQSGLVDAIEITLVNHHEQRSKSATEALARRWLLLANDQLALAKILRAEHFWGQRHGLLQNDAEQEVEADGNRRAVGSVDESEEEDKERMLLSKQGELERGDVSTSAEAQQREVATKSTEDRARELTAHEERKRLGWDGLLDTVGRGRGRPAGANQDRAAVTPGSCRYDQARFTASPSGDKVLLHRPHEMAAAAAVGRAQNYSGGAGGVADDDGCLYALLAFVSLQPEVRYVTARKKSVTMNLEAAWVTQSGVDGFTPLWDENLQGQDEIIGIADTGLDMNHCSFREDDDDSVETSDWENPVTDTSKRKVVQYIAFVDDFDEVGGHGTHCAGSLAGAPSGTKAGDGEADGMAFQGKLAVFDFGDSSNFNALKTPDEVGTVIMAPAYDAGARIHSNSWDTVSTEYTSLSREMDLFVYTHQDFLVVFAAGNCGDTSTNDLVDNCFDLSTDGGTVLSPAQSKNVVGVGASESAAVAGKNPDTVSLFSSKGPTIDGRIKPDVVAPGDPTWSAYADPTGATCEFGRQTGTSMSTPIVAGSGAMARQYFREGWYNTGTQNLTLGFDPSAALLKAVLINSATAMSFAGVNSASSALDVTLTSPPDEYQGFGRVTMFEALNMNGSVGLFFEDWVAIQEGETLEYEVSLYAEADVDKDLRVTLVWTDPPASVGSTSALIHDLDVVVIAQSTGTEYYPNGGDGPDSVNNVEKVVITDTIAGESYTIRVSCDQLSDADSQSFALIANGEFFKTNSLPTTPDPNDWLDLVDQAAATFLTWRFGAILALGIVGCCALWCVCRTCNRSRQHRSKVNKYRRDIITNRGASGRNGGPNATRPHPYDGPMRHPGELHVTGSTRFDEPWRRPGPGSIGGRSLRSMRSNQSARGVLLTGAGAVVPGQLSEATMQPTPPWEACPECGLRLTDVVQLVKHVETQHGGRATRRSQGATVPTAPEAGPTTRAAVMPTAVAAPLKDVPPSTGNMDTDPRAASAPPFGIKEKPSPSSRPLSYSVPQGRGNHASAVRNAAAAGAATRVTAKGVTTASGPRDRPRSRSKSPSSRSNSPGRSGGSSSGGSGPTFSRRAVPRIKDIEAPPGNFSSTRSPLPRLLSHKRQDWNEGGEGSRGSFPDVGRGSNGSGTGGRTWRDTSKHSAGTSRSSAGNGRERGAASGFQQPRRALVKEVSARSLTRTTSLDSISALSSRAVTRSPGKRDEDEDVTESVPSRMRIPRNATTEGTLPPARRLTADRLRVVESGLPDDIRVPTPTFSPVGSVASVKRPAYSPVDRERASELDEERPVSRTRKFLRQLSLN